MKLIVAWVMLWFPVEASFYPLVRLVLMRKVESKDTYRNELFFLTSLLWWGIYFLIS